MKKIDLRNKLQLRRETVRVLTPAELRSVEGGLQKDDIPITKGENCSFADDGNHCGTRVH